MALTFTTINNSAAVAKTFTLVGKDRSNAEWYNATDQTSLFDQRMIVKQAIIGTAKSGAKVRRSLVQTKTLATEAAGENADEVTVNLTLTAPVVRTVMTDTQLKDTVAFIRNGITDALVMQLLNGEV